MASRGPVPEYSVKGKVVVITGGGSGIGFSLAKLCHSRGALVLIGDLKLVAEAEELVSKTSSNEIAFQHCDVTKWQDLHDLISASVEKFGDVPDVYAPVAGIYEPPWSNFWDDSERESSEYKTITINVNHPIQLTRLAIRALVGAEKQGVVCLVASAAGIRPNYLANLYVASKHAIVGFAKSLGQADVDEGIKVICILPGPVCSPLWHDRQDNMLDWARYNDRAPNQPEDIAAVMLKMIEEKTYKGGTILLKTAQEERVVEEGYAALRTKQAYDPSPRPEPDLGRIENALSKERGKKWV